MNLEREIKKLEREILKSEVEEAMAFINYMADVIGMRRKRLLKLVRPYLSKHESLRPSVRIKRAYVSWVNGL